MTNKQCDNGKWTVSVEMTLRISLASGVHRDFSCSVFSTDENCDIAQYRAYHVLVYRYLNCRMHSIIQQYVHFNNLVMYL